jgi:hypothetical protein
MLFRPLSVVGVHFLKELLKQNGTAGNIAATQERD